MSMVLMVRAAKLIAYDVCPCNLLLNHLAEKLETGSRVMDEDGATAASGQMIDSLLSRLNALEYYDMRPGPKSLGREWFELHVLPIIDSLLDVSFHKILQSRLFDISYFRCACGSGQSGIF